MLYHATFPFQKFKFPPAHVAVLEKAFDDGLTSTNSNNAQWFLNLAEQLGTTIERVQVCFKLL